MDQVFYDNNWQAPDEVRLPITNRSFRYGDGLFESFRWISGRWIFEPQHWNRLLAGADALKIDLPDNLLSVVKKALLKLPTTSAFTCRLTLWRSGAGKYLPNTSAADWLLEAKTIPFAEFQFPSTGLTVDLSKQQIIPNPLSNFKTNNALDYVLASLEKKERGLDDLILQNCFGELVEGTYSNCYLVMKDAVLTPTLSSGCLNGTIRKVLLDAKDLPLPVLERTLYPSDLNQAREVWFTSSLSGIRWVKQCGNLTFEHELAADFQVHLNAIAASQ